MQALPSGSHLNGHRPALRGVCVTARIPFPNTAKPLTADKVTV